MSTVFPIFNRYACPPSISVEVSCTLLCIHQQQSACVIWCCDFTGVDKSVRGDSILPCWATENITIWLINWCIKLHLSQGSISIVSLSNIVIKRKSLCVSSFLTVWCGFTCPSFELLSKVKRVNEWMNKRLEFKDMTLTTEGSDVNLEQIAASIIQLHLGFLFCRLYYYFSVTVCSNVLFKSSLCRLFASVYVCVLATLGICPLAIKS